MRTELQQATIVATAHNSKGVMQSPDSEQIVVRVTASTDVPYDALGEAVGQALHLAWATGIDPAVEPGFHIKVEFE